VDFTFKIFARLVKYQDSIGSSLALLVVCEPFTHIASVHFYTKAADTYRKIVKMKDSRYYYCLLLSSCVMLVGDRCNTVRIGLCKKDLADSARNTRSSIELSQPHPGSHIFITDFVRALQLKILVYNSEICDEYEYRVIVPTI